MKLYLLCYGIHMRTQFTQRDSFVLPHHSGTVQLSQSLVGICLQRRGSPFNMHSDCDFSEYSNEILKDANWPCQQPVMDDEHLIGRHFLDLPSMQVCSSQHWCCRFICSRDRRYD